MIGYEGERESVRGETRSVLRGRYGSLMCTLTETVPCGLDPTVVHS